MDEDLEHLRLLSICHYVAAGVVALFACLPLVPLVLGIAMVAGWAGEAAEDFPPALFGGCFIAFAGLFLLLGWGYAICLALAGRSLARRTHYTFCIVVAAVTATFMPLGTLLGAFTIAILSQTPVKRLFGQWPAEPPAANGAP